MTEPANPVLISKIRPQNFLSFGPKNEGIELKSLNVLVGPNGSGKSNLIEAINFMRAAPKDFSGVTRRGGGVNEWIWKGSGPTTTAQLELTFKFDLAQSPAPLIHAVAFHGRFQHFNLADENITFFRLSNSGFIPFFSYSGNYGEPTIKRAKDENILLSPELLNLNHSILTELRDPVNYTELRWLSIKYESMMIYREWSFGRNSVFREPQKADSRSNILEEDFSNLGLFLSNLQTSFPSAKKAILSGLKDLYDGIDDYHINTKGGTVQIFFTEGDYSIPATRLSDGTLRYLCLLAILCDPEPPPLICIEEPELGLHPDILPKLADLLKDASTRTQLIVTTHSDILVDAMTETPEAVVICEKHNGQTEMKRLNADDLKEWLKDYRLGQLWIDGQLGGKRW